MPIFTKTFPLNKRPGFTLIEVMIVVAIVVILAILAMFMLTNNLAKSRDGKRKADIDRIKIAFEDYYGDQNTFPPETILSNCGSDEFKPYLPNIPCDPKTKKPYCYIYDTDNGGQNYRILSSLEYEDDPIIEELNCHNEGVYCGFEDECTPLGYSRFNYGVSSTNIVVASENIGEVTPSPTPTPTPVPLPSTVPGQHACSRGGVCNFYDNPTGAPNFCPLTFSHPQCNYYCDSSPLEARCAN